MNACSHLLDNRGSGISKNLQDRSLITCNTNKYEFRDATYISTDIEQKSLCLGRRWSVKTIQATSKHSQKKRADIAIIRSQHRICGVLTGTLPHLSQQNVFLGVPLVLMPEETVLLVDIGMSNFFQKIPWELIVSKKIVFRCCCPS